MLDFDLSRKGVAPRDASTLIVLRDAPDRRVEVFCVQRRKGGFLGGAIVFPGGALDPDDTDPSWQRHASQPRGVRTEFADSEASLRGLAVAACREALEEAAILPLVGSSPPHAELLEWRRRVTRGDRHGGPELRALLAVTGLRLDLASLIPFARWITPAAESRRFDTRFFLFVAEAGVVGLHDDCETTASFWASPGEVLQRYVAGELQLAPPTHRTLELLASFSCAREVVAAAEHSRLEPICPQVVTHRDSRGETIAVVLPGDPEHPVREALVAGKSRFVLRAGRFFPEDAPA